MEDFSSLFLKLSNIFRNSFNTFIKDGDISYIEKKELTNEYNAPLIEFSLINIKTGIEFKLQYRPIRDYVYFYVIDTNVDKYIHFDSYIKFKGYENDNLTRSALIKK